MSQLFSFQDLKAKAEQRQINPVSVSVAHANAIEGANFASIKTALADIQPETAYQYWTEGK